MAVLTEVVEGWTDRLTFQLYDDGAALVGTGLTLSDVLITGKHGQQVDTSGNVGWISAAAGTVYYDPDAGDLKASQSPYRIRFKVTDGSGKVAYYPSGAADTISVLPER